MPDTVTPDLAGQWRVGQHYMIHVYEGDRPVATFHTAADARAAVTAHNDHAALLAHVERLEQQADAVKKIIERGPDGFLLHEGMGNYTVVLARDFDSIANHRLDPTPLYALPSPPAALSSPLSEEAEK